MNKNKPIFPVHINGKLYSGIMLRDYFAAHASEDDISIIVKNDLGNITRQEARYIHADNMLKARGK